MTKPLSGFYQGQRVKVLNGFLTPKASVAVPANATAEILSVHSHPSNNGVQHVEFLAKWRRGDGVVVEVQDHALATEFVTAKGRPIFPGETQPKAGQQFGVTGQNNDYGKLAKQGRRAVTVVNVAQLAEQELDAMGEDIARDILSESPSKTAETLADNSPMPIVASGNSAPPTALTNEQTALLGSTCPHCNGQGHFHELRGNFVKGPNRGQPYVIVKCSNGKCEARVARNGVVAPRYMVNGVKVGSGSAAVAAPSPAQPAPAATVASAPSAASAPAAPKAKAKADPPKVTATVPTGPFNFPLTSAMKLVADVRTMTIQGTTEMTFSLRKVMAWATASAAFAGSGAPDNDAIAAGFRVTAFDRETDSARDTLRQLFQSHFGFEATLNASKHPALSHHRIVQMSLAHGLNLWVAGPTGAGKTYSVTAELKRLGRGWVRVQGGGDVTRETLVGYAALTNGTSTFKAGPLTYAMEHGLVLLLDEIDKLRDEVLSELTAVLEGNDLVLMDDSARVVKPAPGFGVLATANTVGRGEGLLYGGTKTVNEALRDRFIFLNVEYDNARDLDIVKAHCGTLNVGVK